MKRDCRTGTTSAGGAAETASALRANSAGGAAAKASASTANSAGGAAETSRGWRARAKRAIATPGTARLEKTHAPGTGARTSVKEKSSPRRFPARVPVGHAIPGVAGVRIRSALHPRLVSAAPPALRRLRAALAFQTGSRFRAGVVRFVLVAVVLGVWTIAPASGRAVAEGETVSRPAPGSPIKTVYIVPSSHYDFGFVEPPDAIRERAARHIDDVIRVAEADPGFRWTIESVWQVEEWLKRAKDPTSNLQPDRAKIARLVALIKSGRVALSAAWGSMHTDFMGAEELNRLCRGASALRRAYGVETDLAMMDDVPGHPTSVPSVLAASGVRRLVVGANLFLNTSTSLAPGKVPFYWESPDGGRVLTWVSQSARGGYTEALTDFYLDPYTVDPYTGRTAYEMFNPTAPKKTELQVMEEGVAVLQKRYADAAYPYDAVMAMYAHDFLRPENVANLERAVKLWNGKHQTPKLVIATPVEFFRYMEQKYSAQFPTYRGEWSGIWSEAKTMSPHISALARYAHDHTAAAESLWSAVSAIREIPFPAGNATELYGMMMTYDEHSGAGNTGWPQLNDRELLDEQNRQYVRDMRRARKEVDALLDEGIRLLAEPMLGDAPRARVDANAWPVVVYNPLSWSRTDVVELDAPEPRARIAKIRDAASGAEVPFDVDENGRAIFVAKDVPSLGYATFLIETAQGAPVSTLRDASRSRSAESSHFRVSLRADGTIESIVSRATNRELINAKGELPFNELLRVEGNEPSSIQQPVEPEISVRRGSRMTRITVSRPRSAFPVTTITLYDDLDRVDLHNELDGAKLPFSSGKSWDNSYYFAFPFALDAGKLTVLRGGQKWFDRLPSDYLPDARRDSTSSQHAMGLSDGAGTVVLAHRQAFHFVFPSYVKVKPSPKGAPPEYPALLTGTWPLREATLYSRAMRRGDQSDTHDLGVTNLETVEPGLGDRYEYDYAISARDGAFDDVSAWRFGADFSTPLRAVYVATAPPALRRALFAADQPNVQIVAVAPSAIGDAAGDVSAVPLTPRPTRRFVVRLQEVAGRAATVRLTLPSTIRAAEIVDLNEERVLKTGLPIDPVVVDLKPHETVTVRIEVAPRQ